MSVKIRRYVHGETQSEKLFCLLGEFALSKAVRDALGVAMTSEAGRVWFIAQQGKAVKGFVSVLHQKNGKARMVHLHVVEGVGPEIEGQLIRAAEEEAQARKCTEIVTIDHKKRERMYKARGWQIGMPRGQYMTFHRGVNQ